MCQYPLDSSDDRRDAAVAVAVEDADIDYVRARSNANVLACRALPVTSHDARDMGAVSAGIGYTAPISGEVDCGKQPILRLRQIPVGVDARVQHGHGDPTTGRATLPHLI